MAEPEESPDPESGSDLYRPDPSDSDDEDTLFIPEQLLTEVDAGLNIEETESQGEAEDQTRQSSTQTHGEKKPRKRKPQKKKPRTSEKDRTPLPSSSLSIEDPVPLPMDLDFPTLTSIYWGNPPTASEEYGTVEGENARLWMQAERDLVLDDAPEAPAPGHKRPIDLLDLSPAPLRKIYSAVYPQSKGKRLTWILAFCTTRAAVPEQRTSGHYFIVVTKNREVINDVLLKDLDAHQIERVRLTLHALFERSPTRIGDYTQGSRRSLVLMALRRTPGLEKALRLPDMQLSMTAGMLLCKARIVVIDLESFEEGHMDRVRNAGQEWLTLEVADYSLYMGKELVTVTLHAGHYSLTPSPTLQSDVREGHFNAVKVPLSAAALLRCTEVLDTVYIRTASRRKAWSALSKKADHEHLLAESGTAFEPPPNPFLDEQKTTQNESKSKIICKKYDLLCSFGGDPTGTGNMDVGSESFRSQIRPLKRQHALKMTNAGYNAAFQAFKRAFLQDTLDREYQSGAERAQALRARGELVFDAWLDFIERWEIGESHFVDAYSGMNQPYFESRSDWEARFPFLLSPDAIQPLCVSEGKPAIHVVSNMLPTTWCLNKLKHIYSPVLLHLVWQLSQATASEQRLVIHRKIDHLYLIRLQLPFRRSARMQLDPQDPLIASVQTQNNAGIADPDNCLAIKRPWALQSDNRTFSKFGRPADSRAPYKEFPLHSKIEAVVSQIEERYSYTFKRIEGAVYLFNWENRPVEWTWDDNRRFYSVMLERMIEECNKDYETTCTVDTLFLVHCLRVACPPRGLEWLYYELEPYVHHPFRASGGHAAHGLNMTTGWPEDYETLDDFVEEDCNIDIEPWIWNMMRGGLDHHYDAIVDYIRNLPRDNPPYWQESLGSGPPVPLTIWGGAVRHVRFRAKRRGPAASTSGPNQPQEVALRNTEQQSIQKNVPIGGPQRGNLSNKDQICYASAIIQMLCNVPKLRALVSATSDLPFDVNTGRGLHGFVLLGDPGFAIHQSIFSQLRQIASTLEATNTRLPADCTLEFLRTLRQINTQTCREFPEAEEYDPSTLLGVLLEMLNDAGDRSQPLTDTVELRPNRVWLKAQEETVRAGRLIAPLSEDVPLQFSIHKCIGNDSELDDLCTFRVVYESVCSVEGCQSPFSRGFSFEQVLNLQFPQDDPGGVYKVSDLIENWSLGSGRAVCGYDNLHGLAMPAKKKILTTPEILFLRIERLSLGDLMTSGSIFEAENAAQIVSNPLIVEETIDLQPWCNRELPSERRLGALPERMKPKATYYGIEAIIQYNSRHFFTYARAKDQDGNLFWAKFDDTLPTVVWENPLQIKHRTGDFILVYRLLSEAEVSEALAASETISTAHQSEHGEEFEEIEVIENLNAANEIGDLSDYEDSIGDPVNIQDILNDDGDAGEDDDDGAGESEARKDNINITLEEYSRKSGREKGEYFELFFKTVAERAGSDGGAEALLELASRVRQLGEELQAALDSRQSQKSSDREQSDWDAAVMAALQRQPKQFQDYIAQLKMEMREMKKEHQNLKERLSEPHSKLPEPSDNRKLSKRKILSEESKAKKKSASHQKDFTEEEQSARIRLQDLMFEEHTMSSRLNSMKEELEAVRKEKDHLQQQTDTLRSKEQTSPSSVISVRPEELLGQLRDRMQDLSPQSLGDLIQQATIQLVSRTSEASQKQTSATTVATTSTQELRQSATSPSISVTGGPPGAIVSRSDAYPTSGPVGRSADVPFSTPSQLTTKVPGSAHEPMVIDSDPPESDDVEQTQGTPTTDPRFSAPFTPFPVVSAAHSMPSTILPASLSGATANIQATVSGTGISFSSDLQSSPTKRQPIHGSGQSTATTPIFQTPVTPANVFTQPGGFNLPKQPSSAPQHRVMGPPGRTPQTGERRPYDMIRSPAVSPSRQGGSESPLKRQVVSTMASNTSASPSLSTQGHGLGPAPPPPYGALQSHRAYQAAHTGPPVPPTYFTTPGGFSPSTAAPLPHGYITQAPTTVSQAAPTVPSIVGSVESPSTSRLPTSGPPPRAFNIPAPTTVSQAAPTVSSTVSSVVAPQPSSRLPVPVRSSGTVAPSSGGTNLPAGPSQRGQEASPSAQPITLPPPPGTTSGLNTRSSQPGQEALASAQLSTLPPPSTTSGLNTGSSQPGQGALPSVQPSTQPPPPDTSSETATGSTKPPQTTEGHKTATGPAQSRPTVPQGPQPPSSLAVRGSGHSSTRGSRPGARGTSGNPLRGNFSRGGRTARGARGARGSDRG
ncbi:hypothetical protein KC315_g9291 [Hortaea werneckii]|nr:hypothetical protein KC315_g9291 [Hortaea werneckii]